MVTPSVDLRLAVRDIRNDVLVADAPAQDYLENLSFDPESLRDGIEVVELHEKRFPLFVDNAVGAVEKAFLDEIAYSVFADLVSFLKLYHVPILMVRAGTDVDSGYSDAFNYQPNAIMGCNFQIYK